MRSIGTRFEHEKHRKKEPVNMISSTNISMAGIDSGYDTARIIEVLINTLVQKNVISEKEANYIKQVGKGSTYRQGQTGSEQTG
jgi:hypothetical protein